MMIIGRFRERIRAMMSLDCSNRELAVSFALGMLVGVSPYFGLQTWICLSLSSFFRVPVFPMLLVSSVTNPLTVAFVYAGTTKVGMLLLGIDSCDIDFNWGDLGFSDIRLMGKTVLLPFFLGTHLVGIILSVFTYFIVYYIVKRYRAKG